MNPLLPLMLWLVLGLPTAYVFFRRKRWELGCATLPLAGMIALALPRMLSSMIDLETSHWVWHAALSSLILGFVVEIMFGDQRNSKDLPPLSIHKHLGTLSFAVVAIIGILNIFTGWVLSEGWPGYGWDGLFIWLLHAKVLAFTNHFPTHIFTEPSIWNSQWDYPLLYPSFLAWFLRLGSMEVHELPLVIGFIIGILPLICFLGLLRRMQVLFAASISLFPLALLRLLTYHYEGYAEGVFVLAAATGCAWTLIGFQHRDRALVIAGGLALAAACATKNEGVLWLVASGSALVGLSFIFHIPKRHLGADLVRTLFLGGVLFALWQAACLSINLSNNLASNLRFDLMFERSGAMIVFLGKQFVKPSSLIFLLPCIVILLTQGHGTWFSRTLRFFVLLVGPLIYLAGLLSAYTATPYEFSWHVTTSLDRTLYIIYPAILIITLNHISRDH